MDLSYLGPLVDSILDSIQSCLDFARTEDRVCTFTGSFLSKTDASCGAIVQIGFLVKNEICNQICSPCLEWFLLLQVSGSGRQSVVLEEGNDQSLGEEDIFMCTQVRAILLGL